MVKLERLSNKPILRPVPEHSWERSAVFNCAAIAKDGIFHLIYRACDLPSHDRYGPYISTMGHAVSLNGVDFARNDKPIFRGEGLQEQRGVEDPRVVELDGKFYMMYTAFGARFDGDYRISMASSPDLVNWSGHGVVLDEPNKDASLFPEKVNGRYGMYHRRHPDIWMAFSADLVTWTDHIVVMEIVPDSWESERIGIAGPPFRVPEGWALIYHGVDPGNRYRLGWALFDGDDPRRLVYRQAKPILEPELDWEKEGWVPNVVFSCGQVVADDTVYVYYGGADACIGVAAARIEDFSAK